MFILCYKNTVNDVHITKSPGDEAFVHKPRGVFARRKPGGTSEGGRRPHQALALHLSGMTFREAPMKRLIYGIVTALACIAAYQAVAIARSGSPDTDLTGDMAKLLHYQPTDGATHAGKVRRAVDPV